MPHTEPDAGTVERFRELGGLAAEDMVVATMQFAWYIKPDGSTHLLSKFDGEQRTSMTVGDLMSTAHRMMHESEDWT